MRVYGDKLAMHKCEMERERKFLAKQIVNFKIYL